MNHGGTESTEEDHGNERKGKERGSVQALDKARLGRGRRSLSPLSSVVRFVLRGAIHPVCVEVRCPLVQRASRFP